MRIALAPALLLAALPLVAAPVSTAAKKPVAKQPDTAILATVNGESVTVKELVAEFSKRHSGHAKFLGGDMEARAFLAVLVNEKLFIQEAYNIGLDQDPRVLDMVSAFEKERMSSLLVHTEIDEKAKIAPEEVRATWEKKLNFFMQLRQVSVDTREEAEEIRTAVLHGADFETFARECSHAESRTHGGHLAVNWGQFGVEWEQVVFALQPGELSRVIETPSGFEVILVDDRLDSASPPFDKVSAQIESVLHARRVEERKQAFSEELWKEFHAKAELTGLTPIALRKLLVTAPNTVVATWDDGGKLTVGETFTEADLHAWALYPPAPAQREIDARVRITVNDPLVALEAKKRNLGAVPEIAAAVAKYRLTAMESTLFKGHVLKDVAVTDADVHKYYDEHKADFVDPEQRHVAHILLATEADAKTVRAKLAGGADFGEVARKQSRDAGTALYDGKLGWITPDKVPPAFKEVLTMGTGEISKPLKSDHGWHIIQVSEIKPQRQMPLEEVMERVRSQATQAKEQAVADFWLEKLRASAAIKLDNEALKKFVADNQFDATTAAPQHGIK
jgi:parvulin-like peptidyl-prolyl isomerase